MIVAALLVTGCTYVGPGEEGVLVHTVGTERGVEGPLAQGYYYTGFTDNIYTFPTFTQTYTWTDREAIFFGDSGGLNLSSSIGITYHVEPGKVVPLFLKYRKGIEEITNVYLHNMVRDAFNDIASQHPVEFIYGEGKSQIITDVQMKVQEQVVGFGINIERIYWIGRLGLPEAVVASINAKIQATQLAQQKENELQQAKADAAKRVAEAEGISTAIRLRGEAEAMAIKARGDALRANADLVQLQAVEKWDGKLPTQMIPGSTLPFINLAKQQ
jgi:regulator of protease activity HflC (stomatin/prohibitin superfamily)